MTSDRAFRGAALLVSGLAIASCLPTRHYAAVPVEAAREDTVYFRRRLADPGLVRFLAGHGVAFDSGFTPAALGLTALYFRMELVEARASVKAAQAAEITANTGPFPSATATSDGPLARGSAPWSLLLTTDFTVELGGKRSARLARARASALASELRLDVLGWHAAQNARQAAVTAIGAAREVADAEAEATVLRTLLKLLAARYTEGRVSLADIAQAEADLQNAMVAVAEARRAEADARAVLASALGVALGEVQALPLQPDPRSACVALDSSPAALIARNLAATALRERYEVGAALADYAIAEADLRVQIAGQYPDLKLGPGIAWNMGLARWILSVGASGIPLNANRGPIAEADARRLAQAAHVGVVEDGVLAQVESALAACRALRAEIAAEDSLVVTTATRLRVAEQAYSRGETGQTEVAFARLAVVRADRTRRQAGQRRQAAGAALEAALGRWTGLPGVIWPELLEAPTAAPTAQAPPP